MYPLLVPGRCSAAGETYVNNCDEATCLLNSNSDGYDYSKWTGSKSCPYPAGATEHLGQQKQRRSDIKVRVKVGLCRGRIVLIIRYDFMIEWYSALSLFVRLCKGQFVADAMRIEFPTHRV